MKERIIKSDGCVREGAAWLCDKDPRFAKAMVGLPPLPLRLKPDGFAQLFSAIVSQQVSVASANAIWDRLERAGMTSPAAVAATPADDLKSLGLSRQKVRYAHALAAADIDYDLLRERPAVDVINQLTAVTGIGQWTAEIYAMFSLGRADVFAPGDLALQEAAKLIFDLPERPGERALRAMAQDWAPWRSVAARIMWAYYKQTKQREGIR
ncbi:DNA-3-methyladenine glycosylase family protein [Yoonia sediminilitoris]|uniref:DNA-3-methyladenine glycosylase II n=1 Tax=Yoonia sediminilitoris TaxID=1286148 RepID=A0A2T6KS13_9RHOB|nr:DNA-3-methyladenine glycosylase [Yoonia sediminilitoris]PUB19337.1 DNA-3-methyladenine glycosylase II [Yoonia sediminilitoris]RCW99505.1 DNA-3-methyladenine glycosylase II [Yoonia sediminilitoris]